MDMFELIIKCRLIVAFYNRFCIFGLVFVHSEGSSESDPSGQ